MAVEGSAANCAEGGEAGARAMQLKETIQDNYHLDYCTRWAVAETGYRNNTNSQPRRSGILGASLRWSDSTLQVIIVADAGRPIRKG